MASKSREVLVFCVLSHSFWHDALRQSAVQANSTATGHCDVLGLYLIGVVIMAELKELTFKWSGQEFSLAVEGAETVSSLKRKIQEQINVQPKRLKLLGLKTKSNKLPTDDNLLLELLLKPGQKIMLMG